jgi:hypothetical protein
VRTVTRRLVAVAALLAASTAVATVLAGATPITPGTPTQVAKLVAAAPAITSLPSNVVPSLSNASSDDAETYYPTITACITGSAKEPACVFGDTKAKRTMVLFGDSHAYMWFPAIDEIATKDKWRLVALMNFGCPVADTTVWNVAINQANTECPTFRSAMIARIDKLNPSLLIMSEGFYTINADQQPITDADWTAALEKSFSLLHSKSMKKVLIGNTILIPDPIACLASNTSSIQTCSKPEDNATFTAQRAAEKTAASASKVTYVDEIPWECSATCTVVIGNYIAYNSAGHISATYSDYLRGVLADALKKSMG